MGKVHVYMCSLIALVKSTAGNKTGLFLSPFPIFTSWFLILAEAFRNEHVADCSTALRSATEQNGMRGYVIVSCSFKMTLHSSRADWITF